LEKTSTIAGLTVLIFKAAEMICMNIASSSKSEQKACACSSLLSHSNNRESNLHTKS